MGQSKICGTDEALNLLVDYGKKIYGDKKIEEIEKLENPFDKAKSSGVCLTLQAAPLISPSSRTWIP